MSAPVFVTVLAITEGVEDPVVDRKPRVWLLSGSWQATEPNEVVVQRNLVPGAQSTIFIDDQTTLYVQESLQELYDRSRA